VGLVSELDGSRSFRGTVAGPRAEAEALGAELGRRLLAEGAGEVLARLKAAAAS
jgi:hydroxymethylbilane synthase